MYNVRVPLIALPILVLTYFTYSCYFAIPVVVTARSTSKAKYETKYETKYEAKSSHSSVLARFPPLFFFRFIPQFYFTYTFLLLPTNLMPVTLHTFINILGNMCT